MQNLYPLFERNRVLKKELLWALRDCSFGHLQVEYADYGDGILKGCGIRVEGKHLVISPGILRYQGFICIMKEEEWLEYTVTEQPVLLKLYFETDRRSLDYILYRMTPVLDSDPVCNENEFEVCRFCLQEGAELRDAHTCLKIWGQNTTPCNTCMRRGLSGRTVHGSCHDDAVRQRASEDSRLRNRRHSVCMAVS